MSIDFLRTLRPSRDAGHPAGITSVCSAHPLVLEAALAEARDAAAPVLIEATCNQVNQLGGYTGMRPADFRDTVWAIAETAGLPPERIILGGDHLGPNPWTSLPHEEAMRHAEAMVDAYVRAGFGKIHLDCSMSCADDPTRLPDATIAARAARLCRVAEDAAHETGTSLCYVIGTEVPAPGGVASVEGHVEVTAPAAVAETMELHAEAFSRAGLQGAIERILAIVVQPGVEFGTSDICHYARDRAAGLPQVLDAFPGLLFEAHSTDYQRPEALRELVRDGFGILKVGPWLTFALREALYGLDYLRRAGDPRRPSLMETMEQQMLADPRHWHRHYAGTDAELRLARHFSYSDRIRYYWNTPAASAAAAAIIDDPAPLAPAAISQALPRLYEAVRDNRVPPVARALVIAHIRLVLACYRDATTP